MSKAMTVEAMVGEVRAAATESGATQQQKG